METFAARLASFEVAHPGLKRRASNIKSAKAGTWPHQSPSPSELALAGFYYKPSPAGPDNCCCFLCDRNLDGWEEDDDPAVEHLRHSSECGWAITMNVSQNGLDPANLEDPTGEQMSQARKATFSVGWPHDSKRGWTCKTQKMVDAGWYYSPTPESEDFATCAYCNLSLDGWEPKDNPYNEHYKRSPDCPFFAFKGAASQKGSRAKKSRQSKASRLSTQSSATLDTDTSNIPELNDSIDVSSISQDTVISTASKMSTKGKKGAKGQGKASRTKKAEPVNIDEADTILSVAPQPPQKNTRGKKRTSDEISRDDYDRGARESTVKPEPAPKRRATRNRNSEAQQVSYPSLAENDGDGMEVDDVPETKPARGGRKRASSRIRKVSTASTASKASLRSAIPDAAEIEAALAADLDRPLSDEEDNILKEPTPHEVLPPKIQPKKGKSNGAAKKGAASTASTRRTRKGQAEEVSQLNPAEQGSAAAIESIDVSMSAVDTDVDQPKKSRATRTKKTTKTTGASKRTGKNVKQADQLKPGDSSIITADSESSMLTAPTIEDDSGHETDASTASRPKRQNGGRKKPLRAKGRKGGVMSKNIEDIVQTSQVITSGVDMEIFEEPESAVHNIAKRESEAEEAVVNDPPKRKTTRGKGTKAKAPKIKKPTKAPHLSMPGAFSPPPIEATPDPEHVEQKRDSVTEMLESIQVPPALLGVGVDQRIPFSLAQRLSMQSGTSVECEPPMKTQRDDADDGSISEKLKPALAPQRQDEMSQTKESTPPKPATPIHSPQSSDAENQPPSARPESKRPPPPVLPPRSPTAKVTIAATTTTAKKIPLASSTPNKKLSSPSKHDKGNTNQIGSLTTSYPWEPVDVEMAFVNSATPDHNESEDVMRNIFGDAMDGLGRLDSPQKKMSVEEWIRWMAGKSEQAVRSEGERVVGVFEAEGARAMRCLEGLECVD